MENAEDEKLSGGHLCLFIFLASLFDTHHHGNDFWYFQGKHGHVNDFWSNVAALALGPVLFLCFLWLNERFQIGLFSSWITFAWILTCLHALICLDLEINITLFATFLTDIASSMNDLFLVPILFLNGGNGFFNFLVQGISYGLGVGFWIFLINSEQFNVNYESSLLSILVLRFVTLCVLCTCYFRWNAFEDLSFYPNARGLIHTTALRNLQLVPRMIIWSSILVAVSDSIIPEVYLARFADNVTGKLSGNTDESVSLKVLNATLPLIVVVLCILFLHGRSDQSFIKDLLIMSCCFIFILTVSIFLVSFAKETVKAIAIKVALMGNAFEFCAFSVLCDLMVHQEDVFSLAVYTSTLRVVLSRCLLIIAVFLNYDVGFLAALTLVKMVLVLITLVLYFRDDENADRMIESGRVSRISEFMQHPSHPHRTDFSDESDSYEGTYPKHLRQNVNSQLDSEFLTETKRSDSKSK